MTEHQTRASYHFRFTSVNREDINQAVNDIVNRLTEKGYEYGGPAPHPRFVVRDIPGEIDELPEWVLDDYTKDELRILSEVASAYETKYNICIFYRTLWTKNQDAARNLAKWDTPQSVRITMATDKIEVPTSGDNVPYTYDPNQEYVTDM